MRNWNCIQWQCCLHLTELRAYLWGIETKTSQIFSHPSTTGWEPTYEELKHILQATAVVPLPRVESLPMRNWNGSALLLDEGVFRIVESLPMRNWNMFVSMRRCQAKPVESLPMRNWNEYFKYEKNERVWSWEPTYEELKLLDLGMFQTQWVRLRAYLWGIETLHIFIAESFCHPVESLPMRNWNYEVYQTDKGVAWLRAYLWGIETETWIYAAVSCIAVESLPMRNWNYLLC